VLVNGDNIAFDAYNIGGNTYFKLRDIAYVLNGTEKQFAVSWDAAAGSIALNSGQAYAAVGGELAGKEQGNKQAVPASSKLILNGKEISLDAYNIKDSNYFKLRDIGEALDFEVNWDGAKNTIVISA
jgi:hypothetical protein